MAGKKTQRNMLILLFLMSAPWMGASSSFASGVFRVNAASTAAVPDGSSWENAFKTLQDGADAAESAGGGEVWVAEGTYTAVGTAVLRMKAAVGLYGGFCTSDTEFAERDWNANPSRIDGEYARRCVIGANNAVLDGFTLTGGYAVPETNNIVYFMGGAMLNNQVSPTVRNCHFANNISTVAGGAVGNYCCAPLFLGCTFTENTVFYQYSVQGLGGGAVQNYCSTATFAGCIFKANISHSGGAMCNSGSDTTYLENCIFMRNRATYNGGAIECCDYGTTSITNCTFLENTAGYAGGAVYNYGAIVTIKNSILWRDSVKRSNSEVAPYASLSVTHSCVQGGLSGEGNIDVDPMLVGNDSGVLQLGPGSPCLDAGTNEGAPSVDLLGRPRPEGTAVDMGACEGTANMENTVTLTIRVSPESAGRTDPAAGKHYFARGTTANATAIPLGYGFTGWSGAVAETTFACSVPMTEDRVITAEFAPHVVYANTALTEPGDGASWETAYNSLQAAVDAVAVTGGEVWAAKGSYTSTNEPVLAMQPGVFLYGGFAGVEVSREQRDWAANATVIDGEKTRRCVAGADDAALDGFTVTNGYDIYSSRGGGGMYNDNASPTVSHCVFTGNSAERGGGVYSFISYGSFVDCVFRLNNSILPSSSDFYIGGGMYINGGSPKITGCLFEENNATLGGALCNAGATPSISKCQFKRNTTQYSMYSSILGGGGAICNIQASPVITDCLFKENRDRSQSSVNGGGAILNCWDTSGSPYPPFPTAITVHNCIFLRNSSSKNGDAICNIQNPLNVVNCTFADNGSVYGEAIYNGYYSSAFAVTAKPTISNSVVKGTSGTTGPQIIDVCTSGSLCSLAVTYSCVYGGYAGTGNIDADPQFANPDYGDLRLSAGSPCIDAGTAEDAPPVDFLGIPRPQGAGFDMGAYEYDAMPPNAPVVSGPDSITNDPRPSFNWVSSDTTGAGHYRCGFAEGLWIVQDGTDLSFTPSSDLSDGRYVFYVQERDASGNWSASGSCTLVVDTIAPYAPMVNGPGSPSANPRPAWAWSSGGGGGNRLFRFGLAEDTWIAESVAEVNFTPPGNLDDGEHTLYVQERDAAGNWSPSGAFAITVDTTPPNPPVVNGIPSPTANTRPVWSWVSGGNDGDGRFRMGFEEGVWLAENVTFTGYVPTDGLPDGPHTLFVQERDTAGNWSVSGSFAVTVDTTPPGAPVVGVRLPSPTSARPAWAWVPCGADGAGLFRFGYAEGMWLAADSPAVTFTPDTDLADGPHTLFVQERDMAGNWGPSGSVTVTVNTVVYHSVTVQPAAGGTVTLEPVQPEGGYPQGTVVTVTAVADADHTFAGWSGDLSGTANPATLAVDNDKTLGALFTEKPAEGEGEGETPPPSLEEAAQQLTNAFATADTDGSGTLSLTEAMAAVPGLTAAQFAQIDADGDGRVTRDELDAILQPDSGCACNKSAGGAGTLRHRLGDLFLAGLTMLGLLALHAKRS